VKEKKKRWEKGRTVKMVRFRNYRVDELYAFPNAE
jgi:hypothetical protein